MQLTLHTHKLKKKYVAVLNIFYDTLENNEEIMFPFIPQSSEHRVSYFGAGEVSVVQCADACHHKFP